MACWDGGRRGGLRANAESRGGGERRWGARAGVAYGGGARRGLAGPFGGRGVGTWDRGCGDIVPSVHYRRTNGEEVMTGAEGEYRQAREDPWYVARLAWIGGVGAAEAVAGPGQANELGNGRWWVIGTGFLRGVAGGGVSGERRGGDEGRGARWGGLLVAWRRWWGVAATLTLPSPSMRPLRNPKVVARKTPHPREGVSEEE